MVEHWEKEVQVSLGSPPSLCLLRPPLLAHNGETTSTSTSRPAGYSMINDYLPGISLHQSRIYFLPPLEPRPARERRTNYCWTSGQRRLHRLRDRGHQESDWALIMLSRTDLCLVPQLVLAQHLHHPHQLQLCHGDHQPAGQARLRPGDGPGPEEDSRPSWRSKQDRTVENKCRIVNLLTTGYRLFQTHPPV